jgi:2-polyprenyl-3-methyl-5-hydroxy-6-metoxy-1,4-benzoquinol methylase
MKTFSIEPKEEPKQRIDCPVCGSAEIRPFWSYKRYAYSRCSGCCLVYQNPQPLQANLVERYDEEYFTYERENEDGYYRLMRLGLMDIDFDSVSSAIPAEEKSIIDIGCATGKLIAGFKEAGWRTQGVEICRPSAEYGMRTNDVSIHIGTLETGKFLKASFAVAHCSHLIEHLTDPLSFLSEIRRLLVPGGWFVITTPNISGFQARLMGDRWRSAIADHLFLYSRTTLSRFLRANGFEVLRTKTWGGIGVGITADWIKKPVDVLAKKLGLGDVMIMLAKSV